MTPPWTTRCLASTGIGSQSRPGGELVRASITEMINDSDSMADKKDQKKPICPPAECSQAHVSSLMFMIRDILPTHLRATPICD